MNGVLTRKDRFLWFFRWGIFQPFTTGRLLELKEKEGEANEIRNLIDQHNEYTKDLALEYIQFFPAKMPQKEYWLIIDLED